MYSCRTRLGWDDKNAKINLIKIDYVADGLTYRKHDLSVINTSEVEWGKILLVYQDVHHSVLISASQEKKKNRCWPDSVISQTKTKHQDRMRSVWWTEHFGKSQW